MNTLEALDRARRAWERTSPQLVIDGWLDELDRLDETQGMAECRRSLRLVEPACSPPHSPAGGLNPGAEPCCEQDEGLTARRPFAADTARSVSSAPLHYYGPGRDLFGESHGRGQTGVNHECRP